MNYLKIYFTLFLVVLTIANTTWLLMNSDNKRSDLWFKLSKISWITVMIMIIGGLIAGIWFFF